MSLMLSSFLDPSGKHFDKAMSYRDSEFREMLQAFQISSSLTAHDHVPENKRLRIGIIQ
jgi:6-phosphofructokinase 1